ncbi:transcription factor, RsfA family [Thermobacillus composti KWC4]|jgi:prespore-specific regulator|uniref:Transcription factor, RsfA family n=1 Tax=Thermobacillus composti (strain DSM 18247 / JCM 13945 / KWC4) TaxID=717605 RepID=L0EDU2_THECK|nr:RsfA family transcriptional regulator [Thermobacillus composti]AGA58443.1 transcription factor, RsfA family [Thermobacillus composti KWC4]
MAAVRQDAWTPEDDLILAEVTLRHIREGSTQLAAFEEVGERIGRTSAACGFRWNSCVRKRYEEAIQLAKQQRQKRNQMKKAGSGQQLPPQGDQSEQAGRIAAGVEEPLSFDAIIRHLRGWRNAYQDAVRQIKSFEKELKERDEEIQELRAKNEQLIRDITNTKSEYRAVNDDYRTLIQIMDRARRLAVLEEGEEGKPRFKMDANGNLERIE